MRIKSRETMVTSMAKKSKVNFSNNLLSLQLQLKTLLEDAGGDRVSVLLDALTELNPSEQEVVLGMFSKVIDKIVAGNIRLSTVGDEALKEFEDSLYKDIVNSLDECSKGHSSLKLQVLEGGKTPEEQNVSGAIVDIRELRKARKNGIKPILN